MLLLMVHILINKIVVMHEAYGIGIDQICFDLKDKLLEDYGDETNYPNLIAILNIYNPITYTELEVKTTLLKYLTM